MYGDWRTDSLFPSPAGDDTEISWYGAGLSGEVCRCTPSTVRNRVKEQDGELALQVDFRKNKDAARLHEMLWAWREQAAKLEAGEISQEDYDRWRYHYPEYDSSQICAKVPPESLI